MSAAVVVVGKNVAGTVGTVFAQLPEGIPAVFVDDGSDDGSGEGLPGWVDVIRHSSSKGYGGAQKSGYLWALSHGYERVALVHGDDQYRVEDVVGLLELLEESDVALGSRFLADDSGAIIPWWRRFANRGLTGFANSLLGTEMTDGHTGARAYRASLLRKVEFERFSNDYLFDQQILVASAKAGARFGERPVRVRYDDEVQSISLKNSIKYGLGCLRAIALG